MKTIRQKGKWKNGETKFVIEENRVYLKTLPKAEDLFNLLCLAEKQGNASCQDRENKEINNQKFPQYLLNEPQKTQENKTQITDEQRKLLWEITK